MRCVRCVVSLPVCSWEMQTVGREQIISFSAGGGPVLSNCPNNYRRMREETKSEDTQVEKWGTERVTEAIRSQGGLKVILLYDKIEREGHTA